MPVHDLLPPFHLSFRGEAFPPLAGDLESREDRRKDLEQVRDPESQK